jgi:ribosomal protein S18 acetylase RimI-like enzyme
MPISINLLSDKDLGAAATVLSSAFQRSGNWIFELRFTRGFQVDGYFGAYQNGMVVGMVGAVIYPTFAHVGLMGVHQEFQRRGIGLALMKHLLAWLEEKNVSLVLLDASEKGQPLYEKLGFKIYERVFVLQHRGVVPVFIPEANVMPIHEPDLAVLAEIDVEYFGTDRSRVLQALLETYPQRSFLLRDEQGQINGYLFAQEKRIGPWVMQGRINAEPLLKVALSLPYVEPVSVVVPEVNFDSIALLERYGFEIIRVNRRMALGYGMPIGQRTNIFGQTSLALG